MNDLKKEIQILLGQRLSTKEILGCVIMFGAIILAQLPQKEK